MTRLGGAGTNELRSRGRGLVLVAIFLLTGCGRLGSCRRAVEAQRTPPPDDRVLAEAKREVEQDSKILEQLCGVAVVAKTVRVARNPDGDGLLEASVKVSVDAVVEAPPDAGVMSCSGCVEGGLVALDAGPARTQDAGLGLRLRKGHALVCAGVLAVAYVTVTGSSGRPTDWKLMGVSVKDVPSQAVVLEKVPEPPSTPSDSHHHHHHG